jgi:hypothetical protein
MRLFCCCGLLLLFVAACGHRRPVPVAEDGSPHDDALPDAPSLPDLLPPPPDALSPDAWTPPPPECPGGATKQIYVVTSSGEIYRFDPTAPGSAAFKLAFKLACSTKGLPYSMAVSRGGTAFVLFSQYAPYACAGLNAVNLTTGTCTKVSPFACGAGGFELFGMGFVRDGPASAYESLYIGRIQPTPYMLAVLDTHSGQPAVRGKLPSNGEFTGTSDGELWGFFGHDSPVTLRHLDKTTAKVLKTLKLSQIPLTSSASAVAAWGGAFYVFYSKRVYLVTPDGKVTVLVPSLGFDIVGAGTTCP